MTERNVDGTFKKGHSGNPGGWNARAKAQRKSAQELIGDDRSFPAIWKVLVKMAKDGDLTAIRLYLSYRAGMPTQAIEVDAVQLVKVEYVNDWRD